MYELLNSTAGWIELVTVLLDKSCFLLHVVMPPGGLWNQTLAGYGRVGSRKLIKDIVQIGCFKSMCVTEIVLFPYRCGCPRWIGRGSSMWDCSLLCAGYSHHSRHRHSSAAAQETQPIQLVPRSPLGFRGDGAAPPVDAEFDARADACATPAVHRTLR